MSDKRYNIIGIIPARMGSTRFPGKPLEKIVGIPLVEHVYHRSKMSQALDEVYIVTPDEVIAEYAKSIGAKVVMGRNDHPRCSDITAEAMLKIEAESGTRPDIVVMIQGDEPMIVPEMIDMAVKPFFEEEGINIVNLMTPIKTEEEHNDPNCPKVVVDKNNFALYFSREAIPSKKIRDNSWYPKYKQVCIIPFTRDFLLEFNNLEPVPLETIESIDMNRLLVNGYKVKMVPEDFETYSVDTPADLKKVEEFMSKDPLVSKYARN